MGDNKISVPILYGETEELYTVQVSPNEYEQIMKGDNETKIDEKMRALKAAGKNRKSKSDSKQEASLIDQCKLSSIRKRVSIRKLSPDSPVSQHFSSGKKKSRKNFKKAKGTKKDKNWQEKRSSAVQRQIFELIDRDCTAKKDYAITVKDSSSSDSQNTSITDSGSELTADAVTKEVLNVKQEQFDFNLNLQQDLLQESVKLNAEEPVINDVPTAVEWSSHNFESSDQLFGKHWASDTMTLLQDGIYCNKRILECALSSSHKASHIARRLISGVFKPESLVNCTFTGSSHRGVHANKKEINCLNLPARNAIIDYSINLARKKGWEMQSVKDLNRAMSQRLGEIKRELKNSELQKNNTT